MKKFCALLLLMFIMKMVAGQETEILQLLEDQAQSDEPSEGEEDLQQWHQLLRHPVNLNSASADEFAIFTFISPLLVQRLISYRNALGPFINILELQAVPGWSANQVRKIAPYVTVSIKESWAKVLSDGVTEGRHQVLSRMGIRKPGDGPFPGSAPSILLRYQYRSRLIAFSVNTEKDMGERFFQKGRGISFISSHITLYGRKNQRNMLVLGDFLVNMGQGLIQWQGRAVKKTGMPIMIKRQMTVIQPYRSNDENRFQRGIALLQEKGRISASLFVSDKKIDANRVYDSIRKIFFVSSLQTSGYHRTQSELDDMHSLRLVSAGGAMHISQGPLRLGINAIYHSFSLPYLRAQNPYRLFVFRGQHLSDYSIDYHYTLRNVHFFGEMAVDDKWHRAFVQGVMFSADARMDISLLVRKISRRFYSLQGNAFTESTEPVGEEGVYAGASLALSPVFTIDTYADFYRFPWLKFAIDQPGWGKDFLVQANWKPDKKTIFYLRIRKEVKTGNIRDEILPISNQILPVLDPANLINRRMNQTAEINRYNLRIHLGRMISRQVEWRVRLETTRVSAGQSDSHGFMFFSDLFWTPRPGWLTINTRLMFYETTDYSSRIYAFENDVMYYNVIPSFSGNGILTYLNTGVSLSKHTRLFAKGSIGREKVVPALSFSGRFQFIFSW